MREYTNTEIAAIIDEHIHSARDRAILKARYIDGLCFEPLAEKFDISVSQAKRIIYKHENTIFAHLK